MIYKKGNMKMIMGLILVLVVMVLSIYFLADKFSDTEDLVADTLKPSTLEDFVNKNPNDEANTQTSDETHPLPTNGGIA